MEYEDQVDEHEEEIGLPPSPLDAASPPRRKPRYKECLKNHAVGIGGKAVDGCGEFIAAGAEGTLDALKCAACNCHRNFHRKETDTFSHHHHHHHHHQQQQQLLLTHHPHAHFSYKTPTGYLHVAPPHQAVAPLALPSSSGGGGGGSRDEMEDYYYSNPSGGSAKKRFRTKFTQDQKDKMLDCAERLGWRIQKQDEETVQQICNEVGIKRHVFKVWMHNNKNTLGKKI
ncbi:LOW QUALITY PROTEIN: zinc-finger homeodomain protein 1-like [Primulina tabacum]|uniref:LOW QUALITY PROTEIN: zinc-finger homeodomain protein 1-like n=1 Tax=Primulina tabacum TaxID=48773 RepID=UPI003F5A5180